MISSILLLWICIKLSAPIWVYVLLGLYAVCNYAALGAKIYKALKE